jgi:hypothetical protein
LSCAVLAAAFLGAAMGIPGQRKLQPCLTQVKRPWKAPRRHGTPFIMPHCNAIVILQNL